MSDTKKYIESLQNFSKSIEHLVESLKDANKNTEKSIEETISGSREQTRLLLESAQKLTVIESEVKSNKEQTKQILDSVKKIEKEKKRGLWEKIGAKDKTKSMADGIKSIVLMAGGILAIGSAFKVVGEVDFKSVLALSAALPLIAYSFNKVGESTESYEKTSLIVGSMILMSAGILGAATFLYYTPKIGLAQMFTAIGVSAALGIAMVGLGYTVNQLGDSGIAKMYALIPILPLLAGSIQYSGSILQNMPTITVQQFLSTLGVGVALGGALIPIAFASKLVGNKPVQLATTAALLPVVAGGLLFSANILQNMPQLENTTILQGAATIALANAAMIVPIALMSKTGLGIKEILLGTISMTIMSGGLMAMSHILSVGNYSKYPSIDWASGVGLSMLGYLPSVLITGAIAMTGIGALVMLAGIASMLAIAGGLAATSHIIAKGKYKGGPTEEWASGVGLALIGFVKPMMMLQGGLFSMLLGPSMKEKVDMIQDVGQGLADVSLVIQKGKYSGGPSKEWAMGVGISLVAFASALGKIESGWFGPSVDEQLQNMIKIGSTLHLIGEAVGNDDSVYSGGPKKGWAEGVGGSVVAFASALAILDDEMSISKFQEWVPAFRILAPLMKGFALQFKDVEFNNFPSEQWSAGVLGFVKEFTTIKGMNNISKVSKNINELARSYAMLAKSLSMIAKVTDSVTDMPDLGGIYSGLVTLSLIDNKNLKLVLENIDKNEQQFKKTLQLIKANSYGGGGSMFSKMFDAAKTTYNKDNKSIPESKSTNTGGVPSVPTSVTNTDNKNKQQSIIINTDNMENKLSELSTLMSRMTSILSEIADNTSTKSGGFNLSH